jgi:hypothetical protein
MIRFALACDQGHGFDAWFSSGASYDEQAEAGVITCPDCGSDRVEKAPMAPAVLRGKSRSEGEDGSEPGEKPQEGGGQQTYAVLEGLRDYLEANAEDVGKAFPEEARKIHYGEAEARSIYGEVTTEEANSLQEEGVPVLPLPPLPKERN